MAGYIGTTAFDAVYVGSTAATKVYLGSTEVWSSWTPHDPESEIVDVADMTDEGGTMYHYYPPAWWVDGVDYIDLIVLGGGGGGGSGQLFGWGSGGDHGVWGNTSIQSFNELYLRIEVGSGGNYGDNGDGTAGGSTIILDDVSSVVTVAGGVAGEKGQGNTNPKRQGKGPYNHDYLSVTYTGGVDTPVSSGYDGNLPGGGGCGGSSGTKDGGQGAHGRVWIIARQP